MSIVRTTLAMMVAIVLFASLAALAFAPTERESSGGLWPRAIAGSRRRPAGRTVRATRRRVPEGRLARLACRARRGTSTDPREASTRPGRKQRDAGRAERMPAGRSVPVRAMSQSAVGLQGLARWHRVAADPRSAACALGFGAVVLLAFSDGGYYASTWGWAGALGAVAGIQFLLRRASAPTTLGLVSLATLATLGGWMLLSASWGVDGTEATREAERCGLYAVALAALLATVSASTTRALLAGLLSGVVALAACALGERVLAAPSLTRIRGRC